MQVRIEGSHSTAWAEPILASSQPESWPVDFENHNSMDTTTPLSRSARGMRLLDEDDLNFCSTWWLSSCKWCTGAVVYTSLSLCLLDMNLLWETYLPVWITPDFWKVLAKSWHWAFHKNNKINADCCGSLVRASGLLQTAPFTLWCTLSSVFLGFYRCQWLRSWLLQMLSLGTLDGSDGSESSVLSILKTRLPVTPSFCSYSTIILLLHPWDRPLRFLMTTLITL